MNMYGDEYKHSKNGKEAKEKDERSDIYKGNSQQVKRFVHLISREALPSALIIMKRWQPLRVIFINILFLLFLD